MRTSSDIVISPIRNVLLQGTDVNQKSSNTKIRFCFWTHKHWIASAIFSVRILAHLLRNDMATLDAKRYGNLRRLDKQSSNTKTGKYHGGHKRGKWCLRFNQCKTLMTTKSIKHLIGSSNRVGYKTKQLIGPQSQNGGCLWVHCDGCSLQYFPRHNPSSLC